MANVKKNLAYNFLLSCSQVLIPLISIPYVSRILEPTGIGKVSFIDSLCYYFVIIADFGIVAYGTREVARRQHQKNELQQLVAELIVLHSMATLASLLLYSVAVFILWEKIQDIRIVLFSVAFLISNAFTCEWYFWGTERFRYITFRSLVTRIMGLIALFIMVQKPSDYYIYYGIVIGAAILNQLANMQLLFRELAVRFRQLQWRRHIRSASLIYFTNLLYSITVLLDNVLLGLVSTVAAVGLYAFSTKIVRIGSNVITDIFLVLYPRTAALLQQENSPALKHTMRRSVQLIILLTIPAGAGIFLLAKPIVTVLLADSFLPAAHNLLILAVLPFLKTYSLFLGKQVLLSHHKEKLYMYSLVVGSLLFVASTLVLSYYWHDRGASYALIGAEAVTLIISGYYVKKCMPGLPVFDWTVLLQALLGSALFIPVIWLIEKYIAAPLLVLIVSIVICIPLYFIFQLFVMRNKLLLAFINEKKIFHTGTSA